MRKSLVVGFLGGLALLASIGSHARAADEARELDYLTPRRTQLVNSQGTTVILKGCNLGNWLILEPWMFGWQGIKDQTELQTILTERFGKQTCNEMMDSFRSGYVTDRDFAMIRSFGLNVVRLPFYYQLLQDDSAPHQLRPDAFKWLDVALDMAQRAGVYVILDMHGAPGSQSTQMHTGISGHNELWTNADNQQRLAELWAAVADRYKNRSVVAGYDLINEPYGDMKQDLRKELLTVCDKVYRAIRAVDTRHVIYFPGGLNKGIDFYGAPSAKGWQGVGFTEHYYPGLYGDPSCLASHARTLYRTFPDKKEELDRLAAPYLVGEFNPVLEQVAAPWMMRIYFDAFATMDWSSTAWSYKLVKNEGGIGRSNWYFVTNAEPLPEMDFRHESLDKIRAYFDSFKTMPLAVDERLQRALTSQHPLKIPLDKPVPSIKPPAESDRPWSGWALSEWGDARAALKNTGPDGVMLYATGEDIFGASDSCAMLHQSIGKNATVTAEVKDVYESDQYAKGGLMIRWGTRSDSPHVMINIFPNHYVALAYRLERHGDTHEVKLYTDAPVRYLRLMRSGNHVQASYATKPGQWQQLGDVQIGHPNEQVVAGMVVTSHENGRYTFADFLHMEIK